MSCRILFLSILLASLVSAEPLGTAFTYQGELQYAGAPADGAFDFEFALYDAASGGGQVGSMIVSEDVTVSDGIFSVELDFGAAAFGGNQLWLDIGVREGASTGGFQGLAPRQRITASPFALRALSVAVASIGAGEIVSGEVQRRVVGTCAQGSYLIGINEDGTLVCATFADQLPDVEARIVALEGGGPVAQCTAGGSVDIGGVTYSTPLDGLQIVSVNPNPTANGFEPFRVLTCDQTSGDQLLNVFLTGVANPPTNGWDEEHVIPSVATNAGDATNPPSEKLELTMQHVDTIGELTDNSKTLFNSDDEGALTYAMRIYDAGALVDCIVWGHDTASLFAGNVSSYNTQTNISEVNPSNCADLSK